MYQVVKKSQCPVNKISGHQTAYDYVTKNISPEVSLIVVENINNSGHYLAEYRRIYFILSGKMVLKIADKVEILETGDACYIDKGTAYEASGTYTVVAVNQPAYGTKL